MARLRKTDTGVNTTGAGSAPARRKTASTARKRAATTQPAGALSESETQEAASAEELVAAPLGLDEVAVAVETVAIETVSIEKVSLEYLPSHEEIAALAYTYWVDRGYGHGDPEQDWLRAEAALRGSLAAE